MQALIAYDISDDRTRRKFFAFLREKGLHTQKSVFECAMGSEHLTAILRAAAQLDLEPQDSIVVYSLCRRCANGVIIMGQGSRVEQMDWLVI